MSDDYRETYQILFDRLYGPFFQALSEWAISFCEQMTQWLEAMQPAIRAIYDAVHTSYLNAGAPYGDTQEGMKQIPEEWMNIRYRPYQEGDTVTLHFRDRVYNGVVTKVVGQHVEVDLRPRIFGMPVEVDDTLLEDEIRLKQFK